MKLLGAVLAGGQATRFGSDKALATWRGSALIDHAVAALLAETEAVVVCGRAWGDLPSLADRPRAGLGPLGGLAAALHHAAAHGFDHVLTLPCDTPRLPDGWAAMLGADATPRYFADAPVIGCWPATLAPDLDRHLAGDGRRAIGRWADAMGGQAVVLPAGATFANINTVADLAALDR